MDLEAHSVVSNSSRCLKSTQSMVIGSKLSSIVSNVSLSSLPLFR